MKECQGCQEKVEELVHGTELCKKCYEEDIEVLKISNENNFILSIEYRKLWKKSEKENKELKEELLKLKSS